MIINAFKKLALNSVSFEFPFNNDLFTSITTYWSCMVINPSHISNISRGKKTVITEQQQQFRVVNKSVFQI